MTLPNNKKSGLIFQIFMAFSQYLNITYYNFWTKFVHQIGNFITEIMFESN